MTTKDQRIGKPSEVTPGEAVFAHPLEAIQLFQRWPPSIARDLFYTLIFNTLVSAIFLLIAVPGLHFDQPGQLIDVAWTDWVISNVIGYSFHFASMLFGSRTLMRINALPFWGAIASYTLISTLIVQIGFVAMYLLPGFSEKLMPGFAEMQSDWLRGWQWAVTSFATAFLVSLLIVSASRSRLNQLRRETEKARESERLQVVQRQAVQANLLALQAQIEPHFLFNTLANVVSLIHKHPAKAQQMLEQFIDYLRATLAATRDAQTTLAQEFETLGHLLAILQIRLEQRLAFKLDLPTELESVRLPPMLLQPLVENAVRHGIEPKIEGGAISIAARRVGASIEITVADTGLGFHDTTAGGIGLRNVRERLQQLYGDAGHLRVEDNAPCGARVTISLPG